MLPTIFHPRTCWWCLTLAMMAVRLDRNGKPFLVCSVCGARGFMRTPASLNGLAVVAPVVEQIREQLTNDPRYAEQQRLVIASLKREFLAAMAPTPEQSAPQGMTFRDQLELEQKKGTKK